MATKMKKCCPGFPIAFLIFFAIVTFLYYRYSFTSTSKIDFSADSFYRQQDSEMMLFEPKDENYQLCFYSSHMSQWEDFLAQKAQGGEWVLAIDMYQLGQNKLEKVLDLKIPSTVMLKLIHEFEIKKLPECFLISQNKDHLMLYQRVKQSGIYQLFN